MSTWDVITRLRAQGAAAYKREMDSAAKSTTGVGGASEKTSKKIGGTIKRWAGAAAAGYTAQKVLGDSVRGAVDLGEEINKTGVVFRAAGDDVLAWSKNSATAMGMSQQQALAAAGTFGNMLIPMGFARGRAAEMSKQMVGLASDMASFNNASPEQTLDAVRAGLAGETEPLRRYGVFLNDARIKAEAMSSGIVKASKNQGAIRAASLNASLAQQKYTEAVKKHGAQSEEAKRATLARERATVALDKATKGSIPQLTAAQKAQATYSLIMKDTKDAQGDFARTSDSLANRQRVLKAQYANVTATLGQKLLPVISLLANHLGIVASVVGTILVLWGAWKVATLAAAAANVIFGATMAAWPIFAVIAGVVALAAGFVLLYTKVGWFRNAVDATWNWIKTHWPLLLAILTGPFGLAALAIIKNFDKIKKAASSTASWIATRFRDLIAFFRRLPGAIIAAIGDLGGKLKSKFEGLKGGGVPFVPGIQHGGSITRGGMAVVGEAGPELVRLPTGATVFPHGTAPMIAGAGATTANFYLDRRLIATAVAQADADQRARR